MDLTPGWMAWMDRLDQMDRFPEWTDGWTRFAQMEWIRVDRHYGLVFVQTDAWMDGWSPMDVEHFDRWMDIDSDRQMDRHATDGTRCDQTDLKGWTDSDGWI